MTDAGRVLRELLAPDHRDDTFEFVRDGVTSALVTSSGTVVAWLSDDVNADVGDALAVAVNAYIGTP